MIRIGIATIWSPFKQVDRQLNKRPDQCEMVGLQFSRAFAGGQVEQPSAVYSSPLRLA
jgi:hypothetical protein